jgi:hypothetical protein
MVDDVDRAVRREDGDEAGNRVNNDARLAFA